MPSEGDLDDGYWAVLSPFWERIDIYNGPQVFLASYAAAPPVVRDLFAAHFCESEVSNGGLHQFFMNPTGVLAPEAAEAFQRVGFANTAAIITEAMDFFGSPYPREQELRGVRLEAIKGATPEQWDPFLQLDQRFYATLGSRHDAFFDAMDAYSPSGGERGGATSG